MNHFYAMIMAGGGGTRLWPMSRSQTPKQLLPLVEENSMFRVSVERLAPLFAPEQVYVVAGPHYADALRQQAPEIPPENFIIEPYGRNSGPAVLLGMTVIHQRDPQAMVVVLPSDHHIANKERFRQVLSAAHDAAQDGYIVTLGISPSFPSTAFGYIRRGDSIGAYSGFETFASRGFIEKPNIQRAVEFLTSSEYSWNSGMFIWTARQALDEFQRQRPDMAAQLDAIRPAIDTPAFAEQLAGAWEQINPIPLDYAVMEGASHMAVIPVDIGWSDIGSWDALFDVLDLDEAGNGFKGSAPQPIMVDTKNTLVYSDKLTVTIGVEDIVVVDTPDALMICNRNRAQDVKTVVNRLHETNQKQYL